jgi:hypothetical protein
MYVYVYVYLWTPKVPAIRRGKTLRREPFLLSPLSTGGPRSRVSREVDGGGGGGHTRGHSSKGRAGAVSAPPGAGGRGMLSFDLDDEASGKRSGGRAEIEGVTDERSEIEGVTDERSEIEGVTGERSEIEGVTDERSESGAYEGDFEVEGDFEAEELEEGGGTVQMEGQEVSVGGGWKDGDGGVELEAGDAGGAAAAEEDKYLSKYEEEDKYEADFEDVGGGGGVG